MWHLYILQAEDGKFYTGITKNLDARIQEHKNRTGAQFARRYINLKLSTQKNQIVGRGPSKGKSR